MPPATNEEQFRFLISCIRWSNNGRVDFQEVAKECNVVSKGAAAKRYERMMRAHGIHPNGGPITPSGSGSSPSSLPRARQPRAARDGADRYGKGPKSKADKQKAKQAMFDKDRDADMDDEELNHHPPSDSGIKDEPNNEADDTEHLTVVKDEQNEEDIYTDGGDDGGTESTGRQGGSAEPVTPRLVYSADSPSFAAQFGGGRVSSPSPSPFASESIYWSRTTSSTPATASAYTQADGIASLASPPLSNPSSTTLPQNGFDFNAYTPRANTTMPFAFGGGGGGVRTPEEVHEEQEMPQAIPQIDGAGSPRPAIQEQGDAEVIHLD